MNRTPLIAPLVLMAVLAGCADKKDAPVDGAAAGADAAASAAAPATAAEPTPVADPASAAAAAAPTAGAAPVEEDPAIAEKRLAVAFALNEETLATDPRGQWAATAKASSTYGDAKDPADYLSLIHI